MNIVLVLTFLFIIILVFYTNELENFTQNESDYNNFMKTKKKNNNKLCKINQYKNMGPGTTACQNRTYPGFLGMGMQNDEILGFNDGTCSAINSNQIKTNLLKDKKFIPELSVDKFCYDIQNNKINFT